MSKHDEKMLSHRYSHPQSGRCEHLHLLDQSCSPSPPDGGRSTPLGAPSNCVPLALGSKPKQRQQRKMARLLASTSGPEHAAELDEEAVAHHVEGAPAVFRYGRIE